MDMKKFLKTFFLQNGLLDFEIISQECSLGDLFQKLFVKFWSVYKYGSGEWGFFALYRHEFLQVCIVQKTLVLRNHWSDFEIISQESGFDISRRPNCPIWAVLATGKLPWQLWARWASKIFGLLLSIWVFIADTGSFWCLRSEKQMDIKLFTEFLLKKKWSIKKHGFYGRPIFL